ncbi:MAG: hypothetical protein KJ000_19020 [Pirellulaceae bacterium]|nr:hypothetical protein [Pirellulaceae bacterium]
MVTYGYLCLDCEQEFEIRMEMADYAKGFPPQCPHCHSEHVVRTFSSFNVLTSQSSRSAPQSCCGPSRGPGCCG